MDVNKNRTLKFKNRLKQIRTEAKLTQTELAKEMGTTKQYISELEVGTRNINNIRFDTMQRLCGALHCTPSDIIIPMLFEYNKQGQLVVDKIYSNSHYQGYIFNISKKFYLLSFWDSHNINSKTLTGDLLNPVKITSKINFEEISQWLYVCLNCIPRVGFNVEIGRAITAKELDIIKKKYALTDNDISNVFVDNKGAFYGAKYMKIFNAVQIRFSKPITVIAVIKELSEKGIEIEQIDTETINIRVE
ncbi:helix-turn-helix transcriptional regulator [Anaerofustis sp.]|uniref:helix-turn-helix domain-containing protein n=1 Tax=Anaerofustis sp. TaxID=1872517 RepID=UPI0025BE6DC8|nr:helix-turn-helix transcriptional regulator [Anaerofustis sp.]